MSYKLKAEDVLQEIINTLNLSARDAEQLYKDYNNNEGHEWLEAVERDFSHPSIIGWCPFNETWDKEGRRQSNDFINMIFETFLKSLSRARS